MSTYCGVNVRLAKCLNSVLNVKAVVAAFNQEKDLVGAFSVIVHRLIVCSTNGDTGRCCTTAEQMREKVAGKPNKGRGALKNVNWPQKVKLREARGG